MWYWSDLYHFESEVLKVTLKKKQTMTNQTTSKIKQPTKQNQIYSPPKNPKTKQTKTQSKQENTTNEQTKKHTKPKPKNKQKQPRDRNVPRWELGKALSIPSKTLSDVQLSFKKTKQQNPSQT